MLTQNRDLHTGLPVWEVQRRPPHELDTPLIHMRRALGEKTADSVWRRSRLVVSALAERTVRLGIAADFTPRDALYLAGDVLDAAGLAAERARAAASGWRSSSSVVANCSAAMVSGVRPVCSAAAASSQILFGSPRATCARQSGAAREFLRRSRCRVCLSRLAA